MRFARLVLKNVTRRRVRSSLTVVGMAVAVAAVIALVGISDGFRRSFVRLYESHGVDLVVVQAGLAERRTSTLDARLGQRIARLPEVRAVAPILMDAVAFQGLDLFGVVVQGWPPGSFMFDELEVVSGRTLELGDQKAVLLGRVLAENLGQRAGDRLEIYEDEAFEVVGTYESFNVFENGAMVVPLAQLERLLDRAGQVTNFNVMVQDPTDKAAVDSLRQRITGLRAGLAVLPTRDYVQSDTRIRAARGMAWLTSALALVIGTIGMLNTMVMSVFERTQEIGILRAVGWRKARVFRMIVWESLLLSAAGAAAGTLGAVALVRFLTRLPAVNGLVEGRVAPHVVGQGFAIALVVGLVGALYPACRGARLAPSEALRHE